MKTLGSMLYWLGGKIASLFEDKQTAKAFELLEQDEAKAIVHERPYGAGEFYNSLVQPSDALSTAACFGDEPSPDDSEVEIVHHSKLYERALECAKEVGGTKLWRFVHAYSIGPVAAIEKFKKHPSRIKGHPMAGEFSELRIDPVGLQQWRMPFEARYLHNDEWHRLPEPRRFEYAMRKRMTIEEKLRLAEAHLSGLMRTKPVFRDVTTPEDVKQGLLRTHKAQIASARYAVASIQSEWQAVRQKIPFFHDIDPKIIQECLPEKLEVLVDMEAALNG